MIDTPLRILVIVIGLALVAYTIRTAIETFVLPRGINTRLTQMLWRLIFQWFRWRASRMTSFDQRDRLMAYFAPVALLGLVVFVLLVIDFGFALVYWGIEPMPFVDSLRLSGSSLLTLGFATSGQPIMIAVEFVEATIGLIVIAVMIAYLPTIYSSFSRRELAVNLLEVRAGLPPSPVTLLARVYRIGGQNMLGDLWAEWERWFAEVEETHTSLAALVFFRSPKPGRSWVTAAGVVLDTCALIDSTIDLPGDARARLCLRAGFTALRSICDFFHVAYNPDPQPTDPISITREEFDALCDQLVVEGVPLKPDREEAWRNYAGWRVNYDVPLLVLAEMTMAPYAPWISDRGLPRRAARRFGLFNAAKEWKTT